MVVTEAKACGWGGYADEVVSYLGVRDENDVEEEDEPKKEAGKDEKVRGGEST